MEPARQNTAGRFLGGWPDTEERSVPGPSAWSTHRARRGPHRLRPRVRLHSYRDDRIFSGTVATFFYELPQEIPLVLSTYSLGMVH
jgi:hypothetical protein